MSSDTSPQSSPLAGELPRIPDPGLPRLQIRLNIHGNSLESLLPSYSAVGRGCPAAEFDRAAGFVPIGTYNDKGMGERSQPSLRHEANLANSVSKANLPLPSGKLSQANLAYPGVGEANLAYPGPKQTRGAQRTYGMSQATRAEPSDTHLST